MNKGATTQGKIKKRQKDTEGKKDLALAEDVRTLGLKEAGVMSAKNKLESQPSKYFLGRSCRPVWLHK